VEFEISNEQKLLYTFVKVFIRAAPQKDLAKFLSEKPIDWNEFLQLAIKHKLVPIIYFVFNRMNLKTKFPNIHKILNARCKKRIARRPHLLNELVRVSARYKEEGIQVLSYKGVILSNLYYKNPLLRDFVDIDLAIQESDLEKSIPIMIELGYELHKEQTLTDDIKKMRSYDIDFSWVIKDESGRITCNTELHWQPSHNVLWVPTRFDQIMDRVLTTNINNKEVDCFEEIIHIVLIIIHHGIVDGWGQLRHLVDLVRIMQTINDEQKSKLIAKCKEHRIYNALLTGAEIVSQLFNIDLLPNQDNPKKIVNLAKEMAPLILQNELSGKWSEQKIKLKFYLRMRDSLLDQIKSLFVFSKFYFSSKKDKKILT